MSTEQSSRPLVALISATPAAIGPARRAFAAEFADAELLNLLDDGLQEQANRAGGLTPTLVQRMRRLIDHAVAADADAVLLTCSMYSSVAGLVADQLPVPILGPDEAAFDAATSGRYSTVLIVASLPAALADVQARLVEAARAEGKPAAVRGVLADQAFDAVQAGDDTALLSALAAATTAVADDADAVLLAQYSLTPVADQLEQRLGLPVLSGPALAARKLRAAVARTKVTA